MTTPYGSAPGRATNDAGVSSHTVRSVHTRKPSNASSATGVSYGTSVARGRVFTHSPALWNPPKRDSVANVQENEQTILSARTKSGNACSAQRGMHPRA